MSLQDLKREYEERRQALVDQLQRNQDLDAATQHQIYGAIKEIENFLNTIELQMSADRNLNIELSRDRPSPLAERTRGAVRNVGSGTARIFREHIPNAARKVVGAPKRYFDRRREERRLREEIEHELRARRDSGLATAPEGPAYGSTELPASPSAEERERVTREREELTHPTWDEDVWEPEMGQAPPRPPSQAIGQSGTITDVHLPADEFDETSIHVLQQVDENGMPEAVRDARGSVDKPMKKAVRRSAKSAAKPVARPSVRTGPKERYTGVRRLAKQIAKGEVKKARPVPKAAAKQPVKRAPPKKTAAKAVQKKRR